MAIAYTTYRARNVYDGYSIKREVVIALVSGLTGAFGSFLVLYLTLLRIFEQPHPTLLFEQLTMYVHASR